MEKFKRTFSVRRRKDPVLEASKPHQWQEDERKVREGTCSFHVKYLGCVEVFESRGIQICEEAVKALKSRKSRSVWSRMSLRKKKSDNQSSKSGHQHAMLYVTGDALRVVDDVSKGLIVDQTIEKVSFCAPDRNYEKGFAYICRDGTSRRWMCHGFLAIKESGERLSHAVGCAFAVCLEKKQQREKEKVTVMFNENGTSFTRMGSFRPATLSERLADPQSAMVADPVPMKKAENEYAVSRPHASLDLLERQGSFRGFDKLSDSSPFKRNLSLRVNELPSTLERQRQALGGGIVGPHDTSFNGPVISTILEAEESNDLSGLTQDTASLHINQNNSAAAVLNTSINQSAVRPHTAASFPLAAGSYPVSAVTAAPIQNNNNSIYFAQNSTVQQQQLLIQQQQQQLLIQQQQLMMLQQQRGTAAALPAAGGYPQMSMPAVVATGGVTVPYQQQLPGFNGVTMNSAHPAVSNIPQSGINPWSGPVIVGQQTVAGQQTSMQTSNRSEAESWLSATTNLIDPFAGAPVTTQAARAVVKCAPAPTAQSYPAANPAATTVATVHPLPGNNHPAAVNNHPVPSTDAASLRWQQNPNPDRFDAAWASKATTPAAVVNPFQASSPVPTTNQALALNSGVNILTNQQPSFQVTI